MSTSVFSRELADNNKESPSGFRDLAPEHSFLSRASLQVVQGDHHPDWKGFCLSIVRCDFPRRDKSRLTLKYLTFSFDMILETISA